MVDNGQWTVDSGWWTKDDNGLNGQVLMEWWVVGMKELGGSHIWLSEGQP